MNHRKEVLQCYREWIRMVKRFPISHLQNKMMFNVREVFEIYKEEQDQIKLQQLIRGAREDVQLMNDIQKLPLNLIVQLYQPFGTTLERSNIRIDQKGVEAAQ